MFYRLDALLLDKVHQPICDALYDRFGDNVVLARVLLLQSAGIALCLTVSHAWEFREQRPWVWLILSSDAAVIGGLLFCYRIFRRLLGRTGPNLLRFMLAPARLWAFWYSMLEGPFLRLLLPALAGQPPDFLNAGLVTARDAAFVSAVYFVCCYNRPPMKRQRRRVWSPAYT